MRIRKFEFIKILTKHLAKKLNYDSLSVGELTMLTTSIAPMVNAYSGHLISNGILDSEDRIDILKLKEKCDQFFSVVPMLNIPIENTKISITSTDVELLFKDLEKYSEVDSQEVIYLPCSH